MIGASSLQIYLWYLLKILFSLKICKYKRYIDVDNRCWWQMLKAKCVDDKFEISMSPTFCRQHQVVANINLAVSIHDTFCQFEKTKISLKRFKLMLQNRILIGRECQSISLEHLYENSSSYFWFLTVKSVGPDTNEQHSSFRASAEHISHSRSDLSKIYDEKKFQRITKNSEYLWKHLF